MDTRPITPPDRTQTSSHEAMTRLPLDHQAPVQGKAPQPKKQEDKCPGPLEVGMATSVQNSMSIHPGLHTFLTQRAHEILRTYAKLFCVDLKYNKEMNDATYTPRPCISCLELKPTKNVEKSDGFKSQMRESAAVVEQCRQLFKAEWIKTVKRNVLNHKGEITRHFAES